MSNMLGISQYNRNNKDIFNKARIYNYIISKYIRVA